MEYAAQLQFYFETNSVKVHLPVGAAFHLFSGLKGHSSGRNEGRNNKMWIFKAIRNKLRRGERLPEPGRWAGVTYTFLHLTFLNKEFVSIRNCISSINRHLPFGARTRLTYIITFFIYLFSHLFVMINVNHVYY